MEKSDRTRPNRTSPSAPNTSFGAFTPSPCKAVSSTSKLEFAYRWKLDFAYRWKLEFAHHYPSWGRKSCFNAGIICT